MNSSNVPLNRIKNKNVSEVLPIANYNLTFEKLVKDKIIKNLTNRPINTYIDDRSSSKIQIRHSEGKPRENYKQMDSSLLMHSSCDSEDSIFTTKNPRDNVSVIKEPIPNSNTLYRHKNLYSSSMNKYDSKSQNNRSTYCITNGKSCCIDEYYHRLKNGISTNEPKSNHISSCNNSIFNGSCKNTLLKGKELSNKSSKKNNTYGQGNGRYVCDSVDKSVKNHQLSIKRNEESNSKITIYSPEKTVKFLVSSDKYKKSTINVKKVSGFSLNLQNSQDSISIGNQSQNVKIENKEEDIVSLKIPEVKNPIDNLVGKIDSIKSDNQIASVSKISKVNSKIVSKEKFASPISNTKLKDKRKNITCTCSIF